MRDRTTSAPRGNASAPRGRHADATSAPRGRGCQGPSGDRRRRTAAVRFRLLRGSEEERKGTRGWERERRMRTSPRRPYPGPKQAGRGGGEPSARGVLLAGGRRKGKRKRKGDFSDNPLSFWEFLQRGPFPLKTERKTRIWGLSVNTKFHKNDIWNP